MSVATPIPTLTTERMVLRPPVLEDAEPYGDILASGRAAHMGGPFSAEDAWLDFCEGVAGWHLRGFGTLSLEDRASGAFLGMVYLHHERGDPERELGWVLTEAAEGHGLACEAAHAARAHAFGPLGWTTAVSYIDRDNVRSIRLAERLGARLDTQAPQPPGLGDRPCLIYRHDPIERQRP